jgi:hypothetical protein
MELWDKAERNLHARGIDVPSRRQHSRQGEHGCTRGLPEDCPACTANARARAEYRDTLFAEMARLRDGRENERD